MRIHVIRHVPFEGPGLIAEWAAQRGHSLAEGLAITEEFPPSDEVELLVVMGGPMAADDHASSPWLSAEKRYLDRAAAHGVAILGVCLGAQILAEVAGGRVRRNAEREIGWYPVTKTPPAEADPVFSAFPDGLVVAHWHGDTFDLPQGVVPMLSSEATPNQAFSLDGGRLVGLQCHLEWTAEALELLVDECRGDLEAGGRWVATAEELLAHAPRRVPPCRDALFALLDAMESVSGER